MRTSNLRRRLWTSILALFISQSLMAATASVSSSFDTERDELTLELLLSGAPSGLSDLEIEMVYRSQTATFSSAVVPDANVSAFAGGKAQDQGKLSGRTQVTPTDGRLRVQFIFKATAAGSLSGRFESVKLNGAEIGPLEIEAIGFGEASSSQPGGGGGQTAPLTFVAPSQVQVSAGHRRIAVSWTHPKLGILGFRAEAHVVRADGTLMQRSVRVCRTAPKRMSCELRGLRNQMPYQVIVAAVYPKRVPLRSAPSFPVMPDPVPRDGICAAKATHFPLKSASPGQGRCFQGIEIQQAAKGPESRWFCVGSGFGKTALCSGQEEELRHLLSP